MDDPTLSEVYRAVLRVEQIQMDVFERVQQLEMTTAHLDERVQVIERTHAHCPLLRPAGSLTRETDDPTLASVTGSSMRPATDLKQIAAGVALLGTAVWAAMELLWRVGEWLHAVGWRK
jgi:hypothetical protein